MSVKQGNLKNLLTLYFLSVLVNEKKFKNILKKLYTLKNQTNTNHYFYLIQNLHNTSTNIGYHAIFISFFLFKSPMFRVFSQV